jgi:hypothetical protein
MGLARGKLPHPDRPLQPSGRKVYENANLRFNYLKVRALLQEEQHER